MFRCLKCYKHLLKFEKAVTKVEEMRKGIYSAGDRDQRFKRLQRSTETSSVQPEQANMKRSLSVKSLDFNNQVAGEPTTSHTSTSCVSKSPNILLSSVGSPWWQSHKSGNDGSFQLVYNAFGFPSVSMSLGFQAEYFLKFDL